MYIPVSPQQVDPLYPKIWASYIVPDGSTTTSFSSSTVLNPENVDRCLGNIYPNDNLYHYHILSPCLTDSTIPAGQCSTDAQCDDNFKNYMVNAYKDNSTQFVVGISLDGRIIYSPYN